MELQNRPELAKLIRVIDSLGPSTIQPLVATGAASSSLRDAVQRIVVSLGQRQEHRQQMHKAVVERFVAVDDSSYADIRNMLTSAEAAGLC